MIDNNFIHQLKYTHITFVGHKERGRKKRICIPRASVVMVICDGGWHHTDTCWASSVSGAGASTDHSARQEPLMPPTLTLASPAWPPAPWGAIYILGQGVIASVDLWKLCWAACVMRPLACILGDYPQWPWPAPAWWLASEGAVSAWAALSSLIHNSDMRDSQECIHIQKQVWGERIFGRLEELVEARLTEAYGIHCMPWFCSPHIFRINLCTLGCRSNLSCGAFMTTKMNQDKFCWSWVMSNPGGLTSSEHLNFIIHGISHVLSHFLMALNVSDFPSDLASTSRVMGI